MGSRRSALPRRCRKASSSRAAAAAPGRSSTAGGLVFVGATNDRRLRAFDAKNGKELWAAKLDAQANANPMTYRGGDGKQYVAVVAGDTLVAFALR